MRNSLIILCLALAYLNNSTQAAVYRRGDKISDNFKQLDLDSAEIDPNVAPSGPNKVEVFDESSTDDILNGSADNEILDEADETAPGVAIGENEIIDESANEIAQPVATVAPAVATTAVPVAAAPTAAASEAATPVKGEEEGSGLAKYCKCTNNYCDCCRTFNLPFIPIKGPGCARMTYLGNEKMSISLKYGDLTLASRTVSSKRARPICVGLPGGYSQFCGRVYGLSKAKENFKACLGFELRADDEVEAALRVSCFKFGPEGLRVADAEPLPVETNKEEDDDDDIFGFGAGGDDDEDEDDYEEDEEEEEEPDDDDADTDYADDDAEVEAPADADYGGFSLASLLDELDDDDDEDSKPSTPTPTVAPLKSASGNDVDSAQSKDEKGTVAAAASAAVTEPNETVAPSVAAVTTGVEQATPLAESTSDTTAKTKKSKKGKKNKKKKAADTEGDFAYEILNGLLDFFN